MMYCTHRGVIWILRIWEIFVSPASLMQAEVLELEPPMVLRSSISKYPSRRVVRPDRPLVRGYTLDSFRITHNNIGTRKSGRRPSLSSLTSGSEESDCEPSPPSSRLGRRTAIVDTKNCGDVSPTNMSPAVSPSNSSDESENEGPRIVRSRRRSSEDVSRSITPVACMPQIHPKKMLIKRNTVADFACSRPGTNTDVLHGMYTLGLSTTEHDYTRAQLFRVVRDCACEQLQQELEKKTRQAFSFRKLRRSRSKDSIVQLGDVLSQMKTSVFKDNHLAAFKDLHWSDLMNSWDKEKKAEMSPSELKRREAVWELFKSECVFLIDHLMVLKHCFLEPLKNVQVEGFLMYAEPEALFGNLDELCYVSYTFSKEFIAALVKHTSDTDFGSTKILIKAFQKFSSLSRDAGVYHTYCLNYMNALNYLEQLRRKDDFCEFEKFCEQDMRCHRLQLTDLLVAPMQHCTKLPLLLSNIRKYTEDIDERTQLTESIQTVENSLKQLEDKMKWVKNYERVQEIQQMLVWPPITELDSKAYIPEFLKSTLIKQPCERLLANPKRQLIHEGQLSMIESGKVIDVHLMLFDDILLLAKVKKQPKKSEHGMLVVHRQPIPLDRFRVHEIGSLEAVVHGLKLGFVLVHSSRYQQIIGVYTLQTSNDSEKNTWLSQLKDAQTEYEKTHKDETNSKPLVSFQSQDSTNAILVEEVPNPTGPANSPAEVSAAHRSRMKALRLTRGKSRSMDAGELMLCDKL